MCGSRIPIRRSVGIYIKKCRKLRRNQVRKSLANHHREHIKNTLPSTSPLLVKAVPQGQCIETVKRNNLATKIFKLLGMKWKLPKTSLVNTTFLMLQVWMLPICLPQPLACQMLYPHLTSTTNLESISTSELPTIWSSCGCQPRHSFTDSLRMEFLLFRHPTN